MSNSNRIGVLRKKMGKPLLGARDPLDGTTNQQQNRSKILASSAQRDLDAATRSTCKLSGQDQDQAGYQLYQGRVEPRWYGTQIRLFALRMALLEPTIRCNSYFWF